MQVRKNFSSLAAWQTQIKLDQNGEAIVPVTLPDSLSTWKIVAIVADGTDRYGLGESTVVTQQPLQILSGLPQTVRAGDQLWQKLTIRNTSTEAMKLTLTANAKVSAKKLDLLPLNLTQELTLAAGENREVLWQVTIPKKAEKIVWDIVARSDEKAKSQDRIEVEQTVVPLLPITVREATLLQVGAQSSLAVARPANAELDSTALRLYWQASLTEGPIQSAREWMSAYSYNCFEQQASRAVVSGDPEKWKTVIDELPKYLTADGLVMYFKSTTGSEYLTAYVLDIAKAYRLTIPAELKKRMVAGLSRSLEKISASIGCRVKTKSSPIV